MWLINAGYVMYVWSLGKTCHNIGWITVIIFAGSAIANIAANTSTSIVYSIANDVVNTNIIIGYVTLNARANINADIDTV